MPRYAKTLPSTRPWSCPCATVTTGTLPSPGGPSASPASLGAPSLGAASLVPPGCAPLELHAVIATAKSAAPANEIQARFVGIMTNASLAQGPPARPAAARSLLRLLRGGTRKEHHATAGGGGRRGWWAGDEHHRLGSSGRAGRRSLRAGRFACLYRHLRAGPTRTCKPNDHGSCPPGLVPPGESAAAREPLGGGGRDHDLSGAARVAIQPQRDLAR